MPCSATLGTVSLGGCRTVQLLRNDTLIGVLGSVVGLVSDEHLIEKKEKKNHKKQEEIAACLVRALLRFWLL